MPGSSIFPYSRIGVLIGVVTGLQVGLCRADETAQAACDMARSSAPYLLQMATSAGGLTVQAERQGDTVLIDALWSSGRAYQLKRRNGYDLTYAAGSRTIETVYPDGLIDTSIAAGKPSRFQATRTLTWKGEVTSVTQSTTRVTYLGAEPVAVGPCSFETAHLLEEPSDTTNAASFVTTERWFSPGLNMNLRMITDRHEMDGSSKRVFTSEAASITISAVPAP